LRADCVKIAICDDDRDFCIQTVRMICEVLEQRGTGADVEPFASAASLLAAREAGATFDAYFLDIIMPGTDGMALARALRETQPEAPIVFLTTSVDYTLEAFSLDAAHYVLKPLEPERLETAIDRLLMLLPKPDAETLVVRMPEGGSRVVPFSQIVRTESDGHYQALFLTDGERVRCRMSGGDLWELLSATGRFVLANKGVVLGVCHICSLGADVARLANGETLPISRRALPEVRKAFFHYNCR